MLLALISLGLFALGVAGFVYLDRRRFYRRNVAGLEEFNGYGGMLLARTYEKVVRIISILLIVVAIGVVVFAFSSASEQKSPATKQPVAKAKKT
jgi:hypothetical protein